MSYDVSKMGTIYGAGKYIHRSISSDGDVTGDGSMVSGSLGFKYGKTAGVLFEGSLINSLDSDFTGTQFNFGYFYEI